MTVTSKARVSKFVVYYREEVMLYPTRAWPQKYHGHVAIGLSKAEFLKARGEIWSDARERPEVAALPR